MMWQSPGRPVPSARRCCKFSRRGNFPCAALSPWQANAPRAAGAVQGRAVEVACSTIRFSTVAVGLFSAGASVSAWAAPQAAAAGAVVVDNTSQFRYDDDIPLVVPECNSHAIAEHASRGIIANPNCSTIQMVVALKPINDAVGIERVNVSTYQSVSGAGRQSMELLTTQSRSVLNGGEVPPQTNREKPVAFNAVPKIDRDGQRLHQEEMKRVWETRKILEVPNLVNRPCTRAVYLGPSEALHIETRRKNSLSGEFATCSMRLLAWRSWMARIRGITPPRQPRPPTAMRSTSGAFARISPIHEASICGWWRTICARAPPSTACR